MDDERHWFEKFSVCMERNIRGVQLKKFTSPREIPTSFLEKHVTLSGKVVCVETSVGSSPLRLLVDHHPVVAWQLRQSSTKCLPVHISSVDILNNGSSWLQHVVVGTNIRFTLLKVNPESVSCIVGANTKCGNVGVDLVSLGFASVSALDFQLEKDPEYMKYYKRLLAAENQAEKGGLGMWADGNGGWAARQWRRLWDRLSFASLWSKIKHRAVERQMEKVVKV
ncbi:uncharacterized protein LOC110837942 isoform X2 [Zootermopsis nevadensis]|uniref:uncharacterized protein LOC110837942 isoform X2 n=1 Tax=Zootermopsis nevadensis TaxID=136037 RepID=UPI000B8E81AA|nr:uncharacterized protein LOC110837942 isoform X2 [Zootermopsis nevadensis]